MILVFFILCFIIISNVIILLSRITIRIENFNFNSAQKQKHENFCIRILAGPMGVNLLNVKIEEKQLLNSLEEQMKNLKVQNRKIILKKKSYQIIWKELKKANVKLEKLDLDLAIGTGDCVLTAYLVGITSAIVSNVIPNIYNPKNSLNNYKYNVMPIFNKNFSKIDFNCIISAKLVHIIYIILIIWKGSKKYERASNRKFNEYSYE